MPHVWILATVNTKSWQTFCSIHKSLINRSFMSSFMLPKSFQKAGFTALSLGDLSQIDPSVTDWANNYAAPTICCAWHTKRLQSRVPGTQRRTFWDSVQSWVMEAPTKLTFICDLHPPWTRPVTNLLPSDTEEAVTDIHPKERHPLTHISSKTKDSNQNIFPCFWKIAFFVIEKYFQTVLRFSLVIDVPRNKCLKQPASSNLLNHFGAEKTVLCLLIDPCPFAWVCHYVTAQEGLF